MLSTYLMAAMALDLWLATLVLVTVQLVSMSARAL